MRSMTDRENIDELDAVLACYEDWIEIVDGRVSCTACGSDIVALAAVGVAAEKTSGHYTRWCAVLLL